VYNPITLIVFAQNWGQSTEEYVRIFMPKTKYKDVKRHFSMNFHKFLKYMKVKPKVKIVLSKLKKLGYKRSPLMRFYLLVIHKDRFNGCKEGRMFIYWLQDEIKFAS
jgi:hypothetical protein